MNHSDLWAVQVAAIEAEAMPRLSPDELLILAGMEAGLSTDSGDLCTGEE